jgi:hypothetical protein
MKRLAACVENSIARLSFGSADNYSFRARNCIVHPITTFCLTDGARFPVVRLWFKTLQRHHLVKITHSEGMSKICTGPEFTGPLWALARGHISQFALIRVRQYMITLDLSGDTTLKLCTTTFKRA